MGLIGKCQTTAMGIMPHQDIDQALDLALKMDIPFWPQLPKVSYYEDMYVQLTEHFPGINVNEAKEQISFNTENFYAELEAYFLKSEDNKFFSLSEKYSKVYQRFLDTPGLEKYSAIRGQVIGPISLGTRIFDENKKPIIYNDDVKVFLYDFISNKTNAQYEELKMRNENAFVWMDEPGLEILFASYSGYTVERAREEYQTFLNSIKGPKGVHLCGNPDWSFLLKDLNLDILSLDAFGSGKIFTCYRDEINAYLKAGKIISWGIVPTLTEEVNKESIQTQVDMLENFWDNLSSHGIDKELIVNQAWLAPARCCLVNNNGADSVNKAYEILHETAALLKEKYTLY